MSAESKNVAPEWPHPFDTNKLEDKPVTVTISPDEAQRAALARRFGITALDDVEAKITIDRKGSAVHVTGHVSARATQPCSVSLEPVETQIEEEFEGWFADAESAVSISKARRDRDLKKGNLELPMLDESEDPEPIIEGKIDLGELAAQYISLAIDPYVHAEGAIHEYVTSEQEASVPETRANPFAALKDWKDKLK